MHPTSSLCQAALFFLIFFSASLPLSAQVRLSEAAPANTGQVQDEDGDRPDWLEIRNGSTQIANLEGWGVGDGDKNQRWLLPEVNLNPGERILIFASGKNRGALTSNDVVDHWETAVYEGDLWRYRIGTSNPPSNWNTPGFDDTAWALGPGGFGYGDGDDATLVPPGTLSVYYRRVFNISNPDVLLAAVMSMDYDDGFVAYLNGQEFARSSNISGPPSWNTPAQPDREATFYNNAAFPSSFALDPIQLNNLLQPGDNVLAVEIHNYDGNSSDLSGRTWLHFGIADAGVYFGTPPSWFNPGGGGFTGILHTDFKLDAAESLRLWDNEGVLRDSVAMSGLLPGHSRMRINDEGGWCITDQPTPGEINGFDCENAYSATPVFSLPAGFYNNDQMVGISGPGDIRYTTDGSLPDGNSPLYTGPVTVAQNTVLRARCFEASRLPGAIATATYFINESVGLPVVAVTIPPEDFSAVYDNYSEKGALNVEYFDKNKEKQFDGLFAGYVVGNWSVSFPQKSLQFDADEEYGATGEIEYQIFADKPIQKYRSFRIRNEDDDWVQARMRDRIVNELAAPTHAGRAAYQNVIAFINGEYWGHYVARERLDNYFCRDNYGADPDSVNMVKTHFGVGDYVAEYGTIDDFLAMSDFIANNNMADAGNFQQAAQLLDVNNFTDYFQTEIFVASTDWLQDYFNNLRLFKAERNDAWKFILWDVSYSSGNPLGGSACAGCDVLGTTLSDDSRYGDMLRGLLENPEYRRYFINRFADLMNTHFLPTRAHQLIDANATELGPEIQRHHERWNTGDFFHWLGAVETLRDFYSQRPAFQRQHIVENFDLEDEVEITLEAEPPGAGVVRISTVTLASLPWTGIYFHGNPVTVTAIPNPGYTFVNWSANAFIADPAAQGFTADVSENTVFTAHFSGAAQAIDLHIHEINYNSDPTRNAGDWLEILNKSGTSLDISGYSLRDKDWFHRYEFPIGTVLSPNGYQVVLEDETAFVAEFPSVNQIAGPLGFKLDNDGDELHLFDRLGNEVATAAWRDEKPWPCTADGWGGTLERRSLLADPTAPEAWRDGCTGGSPGAAYSPCAYVPAVSEINYKSAPDADAGDWIELYNPLAAELDLSGWVLQDGSGNAYIVPDGLTLTPGGYQVFYQDAAKFTARFPDVTNAIGPLGFGLNGNGDMVRLFSPDGKIHLSLCFDDAAPWPDGPDGNGYTLESADLTGTLNGPENWLQGCPEGSPGAAYDPDCTSVSTGDIADEMPLLHLRPNPAGDYILASLTTDEHCIFRLLDPLGRVVLEQATDRGEVQFNVRHLPRGWYRVEVLGKERWQAKLVVLR
ncbi:MAG: lamin tail domain-containing protein [Saprospiraceae bacterium]|nr:lamin tail domain-containing protein [Saprospiraceae bacterium]